MITDAYVAEVLVSYNLINIRNAIRTGIINSLKRTNANDIHQIICYMLALLVAKLIFSLAIRFTTM